MNVHITTPTQAALAQAKREREQRAMLAAKREQERITAERLAQEAEAKRRAHKLFLVAETARKATPRYHNLVASWHFMVELAASENHLIDVCHISRQEARKWIAAQVVRRRLANTRAEIVHAIAEETARKYGVTVDAMKSARRGPRQLLQARYEAWWRAWHESGLTMGAIAYIMCKDRTTVIHGVQSYEQMRREVAGDGKAYPKSRGRAMFDPALIITDGAE